jgi:hypothetical protein
LLVSAGAILGLSVAALVSAKPLPAVVFGAAALRFVTAGIYQLSAVSFWEHVAGLVGLIVTATAAYAVLAFELEGQRQRAVLPTFRRGRAAAAIADGYGSQLARLVREPGVRETT